MKRKSKQNTTDSVYVRHKTTNIKTNSFLSLLQRGDHNAEHGPQNATEKNIKLEHENRDF